MHKMENTPRILTILALVFEGLAIPSAFMGYFLFKNIFTRSFFEDFLPPSELGDIDLLLEIYNFAAYAMLVIGVLMLIVFVVNLFILLKLVRGKVDEEKAKNIYTYQLIIGIIQIFINTVSGVCHIISAIQGKNKTPDKVDTREGI